MIGCTIFVIDDTLRVIGAKICMIGRNGVRFYINHTYTAQFFFFSIEAIKRVIGGTNKMIGGMKLLIGANEIFFSLI